MPQRLRNMCNLVLALMVLYLGVGSMLPEQASAVWHKAAIQKEQTPRFVHLLTEFSEELSEEDDEDGHAHSLVADGLPSFAQPPSFLPFIALSSLRRNRVAFTGKTERYIQICVLRI